MLNRVVLMAGLVVCGSVTPALGQVSEGVTPGRNLTITVTGKAKGKPDAMYIELASEATAGNAADAFQQCKQKADAAAKAIAALKNPDSQVLRKMYEFSSPTAGNPYGVMQPTAAPAGTKVTQVIEVKVKMGDARAIDQLAATISRVFDAANKAGVGFRQASPWPVQVSGQAANAPVKYVLEDATALRKAAIADSVRMAGQVKEALAKSSVTGGKLLGVRYSKLGVTDQAALWATIAAGSATTDQKSATSLSPEEVTVSCSLTFTYEVERPAEK